MKIAHCLPALLLVAALVGPVQAETYTATKRRELGTAITEGIRLLNNGHNQTFLQEYTDPDTLADVTARIGLTDYVSVFAEGVASDTKAAFQACTLLTPQMSENNTRATYTFSPSLQLNFEQLVFVKIGDYWHLDR